MGDQVVGHGRVLDAVIARVGDDSPVDLPDRPVVGREQLGTDLPVDRRLVHEALLDQREGLADELLEQLLWGEQVVLVVLLEHRERGPVDDRDAHRRGLDLSGHVHEPDLALARRQVDAPHLADEAAPLVVHRDGHGNPVVGGARDRLRGHPARRDANRQNRQNQHAHARLPALGHQGSQIIRARPSAHSPAEFRKRFRQLFLTRHFLLTRFSPCRPLWI